MQTDTRLLARVAWFAVLFITSAVVLTAAALTPNPLGHGTHTQLGLPPCGFLVLTGYPCPGCGLTTAFAHMARAQLFPAVHANPFGVPLFLVTVAMIPLSALGLARGLPFVATLERYHFEKYALVLSAGAFLVWVVRIVTLWLT